MDPPSRLMPALNVRYRVPRSLEQVRRSEPVEHVDMGHIKWAKTLAELYPQEMDSAWGQIKLLAAHPPAWNTATAVWRVLGLPKETPDVLSASVYDGPSVHERVLRHLEFKERDPAGHGTDHPPWVWKAVSLDAAQCRRQYREYMDTAMCRSDDALPSVFVDFCGGVAQCVIRNSGMITLSPALDPKNRDRDYTHSLAKLDKDYGWRSIAMVVWAGFLDVATSPWTIYSVGKSQVWVKPGGNPPQGILAPSKIPIFRGNDYMLRSFPGLAKARKHVGYYGAYFIPFSTRVFKATKEMNLIRASLYRIGDQLQAGDPTGGTKVEIESVRWEQNEVDPSPLRNGTYEPVGDGMHLREAPKFGELLSLIKTSYAAALKGPDQVVTTFVWPAASGAAGRPTMLLKVSGIVGPQAWETALAPSKAETKRFVRMAGLYARYEGSEIARDDSNYPSVLVSLYSHDDESDLPVYEKLLAVRNSGLIMFSDQFLSRAIYTEGGLAPLMSTRTNSNHRYPGYVWQAVLGSAKCDWRLFEAAVWVDHARYAENWEEIPMPAYLVHKRDGASRHPKQNRDTAEGVFLRDRVNDADRLYSQLDFDGNYIWKRFYVPFSAPYFSPWSLKLTLLMKKPNPQHLKVADLREAGEAVASYSVPVHIGNECGVGYVGVGQKDVG